MTERLTISELAVLRCVDGGARTEQAIAQVTGAAKWWIDLNVTDLIKRGRLVADRGVLRRP